MVFITLLRLSIFILTVSIVSISQTARFRVVCYFGEWSMNRIGRGKFDPQNIDPYLCTHLVYGFATFTDDGKGLAPLNETIGITQGNYAKFNNLKNLNPNLKTLIALGGWNEGSVRFSPLVADPASRKTFATRSIDFLRRHNFNGLDFNWQHPSIRKGGRQEDRENYVVFIKELREEFEREAKENGRERLLLTMAIPATTAIADEGYNVPELQKYLDYLSILSYDYHTSFEPTINHHSPLSPIFSDSNYNRVRNVEYTVNHYIRLRADTDKLTLGIPTYGRSYTLLNPNNYTLGSDSRGGGLMGSFTQELGYLSYYEICDRITSSWTVERPYPDSVGPFAHFEDQWVGYDDEDIIRRKAEYVLEKGLGGVMFWALDLDDFRGDCSGKMRKTFPLIRAAKERLDAVRNPKKAIAPIIRTKNQIPVEKNVDEGNYVKFVNQNPEINRNNFLELSIKENNATLVNIGINKESSRNIVLLIFK